VSQLEQTDEQQPVAAAPPIEDLAVGEQTADEVAGGATPGGSLYQACATGKHLPTASLT